MVTKNLRIAFLGDVLDVYEKTGIYYYTKALLKGLIKKKANLLLISGRDNSTRFCSGKFLVADYFGINNLSDSSSIKNLLYLPRNVKLVSTLNKIADVVYSPQCRLSDICYLLTKEIPFITTLHDLNFRYKQASLFEKIRNIFRHLIVRLLVNKSENRLVVPTNFIKSQVVQNLRLSSDRIFVLPACVEPPPSILRLTRTEARKKVRELLGIEDYILFLGRPDFVPKVLQVLHELKSSFNFEISAVIAGRVINTAQTTRDVTKTGLDNVIVLSSVSEHLKWFLLRGAKVFLFPIEYGGFGIPPVEAMSVGTPVVAPKNNLMLEVVGSGGLLAKNDVHSLAEAVYNCCTDDILAHNLTLKGLKKAKSYTQEQVTIRFLDFINSIPRVKAAAK